MVTRIAHDVRERLRDETGMALVMAIGVTMVIAIMGGSLVLYSTSNEKIANRSKGDLRAYQLAQSGIDSAASVIAQTPVTNGRQNAAIFSAMTTAQRTLTFGAGESVVYTGALYDDTPAVSGTPIVRSYRWVLTATSAVPNPNAGGPSIARTVSATMLLSPRAPATTVQSQAWKYVYSKKTDNVVLTCDITLPNNSNYSGSFYTNGTLCLTGTGDILGNGGSGPPIEVIAKGGIWVNAVQSYIGLGNPVNRVETPVNGCKYRTGTAGACTVARHVTAVAGGIIAPPTTTVAAPTASFANSAALASPGPGPGNTCQTKSGSYPDFASMTITSTFDLTGATYVCKTNAGELSYDSATRVLTIRGLIYFPGNLVANGNVAVRYQGIAAIYVAGTYEQAQVALCAAISGSSCDSTNWDTTNNVLLIAVAGANGTLPSPCTGAAASFTNQTQFQGAVYADGTTNICARNNSSLQGPSIANVQDFDNSILYQPMPASGVVSVPFGAPGQTTPVSDYDLTSPTKYTG